MAAQKNLSIKDKIELLLKLQKINQENHVLLEDIDSLGKELEQDKKKYEIKKSQYDKHFPYLQKIEKEYEQLEKEIKDISEKIAKGEEAKKKIRTVKEFKAINKEIEFFIRESAVKENELLSKSGGLEFKRDKIQKIEQQIKEVEETIALKDKDIEALTTDRQEMINQKLKEKENIEKNLPQSLIKIFNRIYHNREQKAIVPLVDQVCNGCHIKIPLQEKFDIQKADDVSFCPYCSRILYVQE